MHPQDMPQDGDEIKPGESLSTPAWWEATRAMTAEQRGFAISTLIFMHESGWQDVPDARTLAKELHCHLRTARRLLLALEAVPAHTVAGQVERLKRWPRFLIEELRA